MTATDEISFEYSCFLNTIKVVTPTPQLLTELISSPDTYTGIFQPVPVIVCAHIDLIAFYT